MIDSNAPTDEFLVRFLNVAMNIVGESEDSSKQLSRTQRGCFHKLGTSSTNGSIIPRFKAYAYTPYTITIFILSAAVNLGLFYEATMSSNHGMIYGFFIHVPLDLI